MQLAYGSGGVEEQIRTVGSTDYCRLRVAMGDAAGGEEEAASRFFVCWWYSSCYRGDLWKKHHAATVSMGWPTSGPDLEP